MNFHVLVSPVARRDVERIFAWLQDRSSSWAEHWLEAFELAVIAIGNQPERHAMAPEAARLKRDIRQFFFKTRHGRRYRLIFALSGQELRILRVRAPSERPIEGDDLD